MKNKIVLLFTVLLLSGQLAVAQSPIGTWKGTSICQVKNSPCHDEVVVYHISKDSIAGRYRISANKIVDGKEDFMGILPCTFNAKQNILLSVDTVRNARWEFTINGNKMHGILTYKGTLYRIVEIKKED